MKKLFIILAIVAAGVATYIVITLKSGVELDEISPLETEEILQIDDKLETMSEEMEAEFMRQVEGAKSNIIEKMAAMPIAPRLIAAGDFKPRFHGVKGQARLIETNSQKILRFENFETDNGPALHIYLASDLSSDDFVDLGEIRATKGNVNYEVDASVDTSRYNKVLVWCVPFGVLFSYAELIAQQ
jgi:hypothetical protein